MGEVDLSVWPEVDLGAASARELLAAIEAGDVRAASENYCLGVVAAGERVCRYISALQVRYLNRAAYQAGLGMSVPGGATYDAIDGIDSIAAEVALALSVSRKMATDLTGDSVLLCRELPSILQLVEDGLLDRRAAVSVYAQMRNCLTPGTPQWDAVQAALAELLPGKSVRQAVAAAQRAVQAIDPDAAKKRHEQAKQDRSVRVYPLPDGMGCLEVRLRADVVMMVDAVLDALADGCRDAARRSGQPDPRSHQQRRADALEAVFRAIQEGTRLPFVGSNSDEDASGPCRPVATPAAVGEGRNSGRAAQGGGGGTAGETWATPATGVGGPVPTEEQDAPKVLGWWYPTSLPLEQGRKPHLVLTMSVETLRGDNEQPGNLEGFGAISASLAREIARQAGRVTVVPVQRKGSVGAGGMGVRQSADGHGPGDQANCAEPSRRYKPRQTVVDKVMGRFQHCVHPGCTRKAAQCDVDHAIPFAKGGRSCPCNLLPLCRFHHRLKTHGGWSLRLTRPDEPYPQGSIEWRSRLGQRLVEPPPVLPGTPDWDAGLGSQGRMGTGSAGTGGKKAEREGMGRERAEREGMGRERAEREGAGRERAEREGAGREREGTGRERDGSERAGCEGNGLEDVGPGTSGPLGREPSPPGDEDGDAPASRSRARRESWQAELQRLESRKSGKPVPEPALDLGEPPF